MDIACETICSVSTDRAETYRRARYQIGIYIFHPVSGPVADYMRVSKERKRCLETMMTRGPQALTEVVDDKLVEAFSITGTPDECRRKLKDFDDCLPHRLLHPPYVPVLSEEESADACADIISTFGR